MKFYDMKKELAYFTDLSDEKQLIVMYGRRRIGKTTLVKELFKTKKGIYFFVETMDRKALLTSFSNTTLGTREVEMVQIAIAETAKLTASIANARK